MARYGTGAEDFNDEARRMAARRQQREAAIRQEALYQEELQATEGYEEAGARKAVTRRRAQEEARSATERQSSASERITANAKAEAEAVDLNTAAIERNAQARQRAAQTPISATGRRPLDPLRGANDPLLGQAYALGQQQGQPVPGAVLRRELGIGSYRARDLRAALTAGAAPEGATPYPVRRAQIAVEAAEANLVQATKSLTNLRRRASASDAERGEALAARELAQANLQAARQQLESAQRDAAARAENAGAIEREAAAHNLAAERAASRQPGTALITHPELFNRQAFAQATEYGPRRPIQETVAQGVGGHPTGGGQLWGSGHQQRMSQIQQEAEAENRARDSASAQATQRLQALEAQTVSVAGAQRQAIIQQKAYSDEMHRHGALTAEFIQALARGEVTLRQFGNELLVTAGKFAGWTIAATAIYGAARAIGTLGHGAIAAQAGVHTLDRVINNVRPGRAIQQFNQLSREFNVPIETVVDAVYRMGQSFHDQDEAVYAARAALYSFKTGEVDVASSTGNLIAITKAYHLTAAGLGSVYNQINQAQNLFGIRIGETEKGVGNAAGTWRNAGGDLTYLLSLFVAINKATSQSGTTIGTAINRAVTQFRTPSHAATLKNLGVDYDAANIQHTIESAFKVAANATGLQRRQLAQALFGNQYARLIEPVLSDPRLQRQARRQLDPNDPKVQTSAARELAKVLKQADEQIHAIGNTMQRIGAEMQQAGLFTFAGLMLRGLNDVLLVTEDLLHIFNMLPAPLRHALTLLLEMGIAMRVASRFGLDQRIAQVPVLGGFVDPRNRLRQQVLSDSRATTDAARRQMEAETAGLAQAQTKRVFNQEMHGPFLQQYEQSRLPGGAYHALSTEQKAALDAQALARQQVLAGDERAVAVAERRVQIAGQMLRASEEELAAVEGSKAATIERVMAERNLTVVPPGARVPGGIAEPVGSAEYLAAQRGGRPDLSPGARRFAINSELALAGLRGRLEGTGGETRNLGRAYNAVERTTQRGITTTSRVITSVANAGVGMRSFGTRVSGLVESLGAFDYALIGIPLLLELQHLIRQAGEDAGREIDALNALPDTQNQTELRQKLNEARRKAKAPKHDTNILRSGILGHALDFIAFDERLFGIDAASPREVADQQRRTAEQSAENIQRRLRLQQQARRAHRPVPQRDPSDIVRDIDATTSQAAAGHISRQKLEAALRRYNIEIQTAFGTTPNQARTLHEHITALARVTGNLGDYARSLRALDDKGLAAEMQAASGELELYGVRSSQGQRAMEHLRLGYADARRRFKGSSAQSIQALTQATQSFFQAVDQAAQDDLQSALTYANTEAQRREAYNQMLQEYEQSLGHIETTHLRRGNTTVRTRVYTDAERRKLRDTRATIRDQAYQDRQQGRDVLQSLEQSGTADSGEQAAIAVRFARQQLDDARRHYGRRSRQYRQALTALNQAQLQQAQTILADVQANNSLLEARAQGDPIREARPAVTAARNVLNAMLADRSHFDSNAIKQARADVIRAEKQRDQTTRDNAQQVAQLQGQIQSAKDHLDPVKQAQDELRAARTQQKYARTRVERLQAYLDLINAQNALDDALRQRAQDNIESIFALRESRTDDPVKQALLEVRKARQLSGLARTPAERRQARAEVNNNLRNYYNAYVQSQLSEIEFRAHVGRLTSEGEIAALRRLLHYSHLSRDARRQILTQIYDLQHENDQQLELNVGNVRLPTLYDVRRMAQAGTAAGRQTQITQVNNVTVHTSGTNANDVALAFERHAGTGLKSAIRAGR